MDLQDIMDHHGFCDTTELMMLAMDSVQSGHCTASGCKHTNDCLEPDAEFPCPEEGCTGMVKALGVLLIEGAL